VLILLLKGLDAPKKNSVIFIGRQMEVAAIGVRVLGTGGSSHEFLELVLGMCVSSGMFTVSTLGNLFYFPSVFQNGFRVAQF